MSTVMNNPFLIDCNAHEIKILSSPLCVRKKLFVAFRMRVHLPQLCKNELV